jgi:hypothetical protein
MTPHRRLRFDGWIAGIGTSSGTRLVLGHWQTSPFGPVSDVMIEHPGGHRQLLAPTPELGQFIAETYAFDEVTTVPVTVSRAGPQWSISAGPLTLSFTTGGRGALGALLRSVPPPLAQNLSWVRLISTPATVLQGVRTYGTAGNHRREWYAAQDLHQITSAAATLNGTDLGPLTEIDPPVRFGFTSTPSTPSLTRVTTTIQLPR